MSVNVSLTHRLGIISIRAGIKRACRLNFSDARQNNHTGRKETLVGKLQLVVNNADKLNEHLVWKWDYGES